MKTLLSKVLFALLTLVSTIVLGLIVPILFSSFISMTTPATFAECVMSIPFWIFTVLGLICAGIYINDEIRKLVL